MTAPPLSATIRQRVVDQMVALVSRQLGPDFDFVLVIRARHDPTYVLTDVNGEHARDMLRDALHHPDAP